MEQGAEKPQTTDRNLKRLNIVNIISDKFSPVRHAQLATYLPLLTGPRELHLNFVWFTPHLLDEMSIECLDLQLLALEIFSPNFKSSVTTGHWTQMTERRPNLEVYLTMRDSAADAENAEQVLIALLFHLPADVEIAIMD